MRILYVFPARQIAYGENQVDPGLAHCFLTGYLQERMNCPVKNRAVVVKDNGASEIENFRPDVVAITAMTYNFVNASLVAAEAKRRGSAVIVGGHHLSSLPGQIGTNMDVGVIGEGEQTYLELVSLFREGKWSPNDWANVRGVVFRQSDGKLYTTPPRPHVADLDSVGHPIRELGPVTPSTQRAMITSRGCPYRCTFCSQTRFWRESVRFHSPEYIMKEIENIYAFSGVGSIRIDDAIFLLSKKRLKEILRLWERHPLREKVRFSCNGRANLIDEEMVELAKRMGIDGVSLGFESNNSVSLSYLKGGSVTPDDNQRAYDILSRSNVHVFGTFIIGLPEETRDRIMDTYRFIKKNVFLSSETFHLVPLPGTPVWDEALTRGLVTEDMDFRVLGGKEIGDDAVFLTEKLSRREMVGFIRKFNKLRIRNLAYSVIIRALRLAFSHPLSIPRKIAKLVGRNG